MKFVETSYGNSINVLAFIDHYVAVPVVIDSTDATITANSDGKKIVPAGTPVGGGFLASNTVKATVQNDADAEGILLYDVDVTYGDKPGAAVIHGFVSLSKAVENGVTITALAQTALKPAIKFLY